MLISAKELIQKSLTLYQKNYQLFVKYLLLLLIPASIILFAGMFTKNFQNMRVDFNFFIMPPIIYFLIVLACSLASLWISLALLRVLVAAYTDKPIKALKEELQNAAPLIVPALLVSILTSFIILGGIVLLIVPGIIFAIWFGFAFYAVVLDQNKPVEALKTSKNLVQDRWWAVWWRLFAPAVLFTVMLMLAQWLINIPIGIILKNAGSWLYPANVVIFNILSAFVSLLFSPLTTAATVILYLELKKTPVGAIEKSLESPQLEPPQQI